MHNNVHHKWSRLGFSLIYPFRRIFSERVQKYLKLKMFLSVWAPPGHSSDYPELPVYPWKKNCIRHVYGAMYVRTRSNIYLTYNLCIYIPYIAIYGHILAINATPCMAHTFHDLSHIWAVWSVPYISLSSLVTNVCVPWWMHLGCSQWKYFAGEREVATKSSKVTVFSEEGYRESFSPSMGSWGENSNDVRRQVNSDLIQHFTKVSSSLRSTWCIPYTQTETAPRCH